MTVFLFKTFFANAQIAVAAISAGLVAVLAAAPMAEAKHGGGENAAAMAITPKIEDALNKISRTCRRDVVNLCSAVAEDAAAATDCLASNKAALSPRCKRLLPDMLDLRAMGAACEADAAAHCADIPDADGQRLACLTNHKADLSEACSAGLDGIYATYGE